MTGHRKLRWALVMLGTFLGDDVPTLVARDGVHPSNPQKYEGDCSAEGLKNSGYILRNYATLLAYAEVIRNVLQPARGK
jgi:hypothetical protein